MPWIVGGAVLGGALISSGAAKNAASGQEAAANSATAEQRRQFDLARSDQAPYRSAGSGALSLLSRGIGVSTPLTQENFDAQAYLNQNPDVAADPFYGTNPYQHYIDHGRMEIAGGQRQLGFNDPNAASAPGTGDFMRRFKMEDFQNDPVNQIQGSFMQDEARKAIERRAAAVGGWDSGATLKALTRFGSDYGNQRAGESYNRFVGDQTNQFNRLASVSGIGQTSAAQSATLGANAATNIGNNTMQAANARGAAGVAGANAITGGINTGLNFYQGQQFLNRLAPQAPQVQAPAWNPYATGDFPAPSQFMNT